MMHFRQAAALRRRIVPAITTIVLEEDAGFPKQHKTNLRRDTYDQTNHQL